MQSGRRSTGFACHELQIVCEFMQKQRERIDEHGRTGYGANERGNGTGWQHLAWTPRYVDARAHTNARASLRPPPPEYGRSTIDVNPS
jgi:hypothetical protein